MQIVSFNTRQHKESNSSLKKKMTPFKNGPKTFQVHVYQLILIIILTK